jgi:hypothetical protein
VLFGTGFFSFGMAENKNIEVEYLATAKDYRRVLLWYRWKRLALTIAIAVLIGIPILYAAFFSADTDNRPPGIVLWFLLILPLLVLASFYWGIWRQAEKIEKVFEPVKVVFSADGMESAGELSSAGMDWDQFYKIYETKNDFIFFPEKKIFYTIPKRFFDGQNSVVRFRELLREKLDRRAKLQN